jgi:hypothetical protein
MGAGVPRFHRAWEPGPLLFGQERGQLPSAIVPDSERLEKTVGVAPD